MEINKDTTRKDELRNPNLPEGPRDGFDNTGTQGYDSLKDDGYTGTGNKPIAGNQDGTGSSSEDFHNVKPIDSKAEDEALDAGI